MEEIWKDVIGYEGLYQVSNLGTIKSLSRTRKNHTNGIACVKERMLNPSTSNGYKCVQLRKNCSGKFIAVHRLVALMFLNNTEDKPTVNHIDGNKLNNVVSNLEWATYTENNIHAIKNKLRLIIGEDHFAASFSDNEVIELRKIIDSGLYTQRSIANAYSIKESVVSKIKTRATWKHI